MSTEMIAVRLTSEQKQKLEQLASQRKQTVSDVIRAWIDDDDNYSVKSTDTVTDRAKILEELQRIHTESLRKHAEGEAAKKGKKL